MALFRHLTGVSPFACVLSSQEFAQLNKNRATAPSTLPSWRYNHEAFAIPVFSSPAKRLASSCRRAVFRLNQSDEATRWTGGSGQCLGSQTSSGATRLERPF